MSSRDAYPSLPSSGSRRIPLAVAVRASIRHPRGGIGGDDSNVASGNVYEGVMTVGRSSNATDDGVQPAT
jgi:hypothetical protein